MVMKKINTYKKQKIWKYNGNDNRWIDATDLPTKDSIKGQFPGIDWENTVGCVLKLNYEHICCDLLIKEIIRKKGKVYVVLTSDEFGDSYPISTSSLISVRLKPYISNSERDCNKWYFKNNKGIINYNRWIDCSSFPTHKTGANKGETDWSKCIGIKTRLKFDDVECDIEIIELFKENKDTKIIINSEEFGVSQPISIGHFKNVVLSAYLKIYNRNHFFQTGEVVNGLEIIELTRKSVTACGKSRTVKAYKYKCTNCPNEGIMTEGHLIEGNHCPVCRNNSPSVLKGYNDIATVRKDLVKYFLNKNEAALYTQFSNVKTKMICPECQSVRSYKIDDLSRKGFTCKKCSDKKSIAEKFMYNILDSLNINFKHGIEFEWSKKVKCLEDNSLSGDKEYDFYIPSLNMIIETHGVQHYEQVGFTELGGRTIQQEQLNDKIKMEVAKENGIYNYVVIDCRKNEFEYLKNNIINQLSSIIDLSEVDFEKCYKESLKSLVIKTCELWNTGKFTSAKHLSEHMNIGYSAVLSYLKKGTSIGFCEYIPSRCNRKPVIAIDKDGNVFGPYESARELVRGMKEITSEELCFKKISLAANGKIKTHKGYRFEFFT